ncbi:DUF4383 domain-containing protein [Pseudonocardia alni]|uniref:Lysylphosphatidylglycerol synthetase-like protein (DUF2156 family) n=1 Tax=Pseudonocardia alni TaxID=33907 RepID=A0A852W3S8_PSEA5|nr:DUF4383 domain-containing protein [Pseudonocardia antarctica]NYG00222.1 lysylphosphatidylglycerol synthetase-like protein (DUF2156 family) [Pseudonocardia antarctica]
MPVQSEHHSHGHAIFPWPQLLVVLSAFLMLLYGMIGFRYSGLPGVPYASRELLGIAVDPLRDLGHLLLGIAGLLCASTLRSARVYGGVLVVVGVVEAVAGSLTGVFGLVPAGPLVMNTGSVVMAVVMVVLGAPAVFGRVRSDMPYERFQRDVENAGRRLTGIRGRSTRRGSDEE